MTTTVHIARAAVAADFDLGPAAGTVLSPELLPGLDALLRRYRSVRSAVVVGALELWIRNAEAALPVPERRGIVLGTAAGAGPDIEEFLRQTVHLGDHLVNPALFPHTVHNAVAGNAAIAAQCRGPNVVVSAGPGSARSAFAAALDLLRDGSADLVFTGGFESCSLGTVAVITAVSTDPALLGRAHLKPWTAAALVEPSPGQADLAPLLAFAEAFPPRAATHGDRTRQPAAAR